MSDFIYQKPFPIKEDSTQYRLITKDYVSTIDVDGRKILKVDPKKNQINLFSQNPEVGEHYSFLNGKVEGKPCEISFNHHFLLDGLLSIISDKQKNSEVVLELTSSEKPGVIRPKGDDSYLYLVMPIKTT